MSDSNQRPTHAANSEAELALGEEGLAPRFSIGFILGSTAGCALFFFLASVAARGNPQARVFVAVVALGVVSFCMFGLTYALAWTMARVRRSDDRAVRSPFAHGTMPPQHVIPDDD